MVGFEKIEARLKRAENEGVSRPSAEMIFPWDPRLLKNVRRFRDHVRRVMNCQALGLNLKSLFISYYDKETDCKLSVDGFDLRWEMLLDVFNDPNHSEFVIEVRLKCFDLNNPLLRMFEDNTDPVAPAVYSAVQSKEDASPEDRLHAWLISQRRIWNVGEYHACRTCD